MISDAEIRLKCLELAVRWFEMKEGNLAADPVEVAKLKLFGMPKTILVIRFHQTW